MKIAELLEDISSVRSEIEDLLFYYKHLGMQEVDTQQVVDELRSSGIPITIEALLHELDGSRRNGGMPSIVNNATAESITLKQEDMPSTAPSQQGQGRDTVKKMAQHANDIGKDNI